MKKLILHIGRHKTGTTALQYNFHVNSKRLADAGLHYPETGKDWVAHHHVADRVAALDDDEFDPAKDQLLSSLLDELNHCGKDTVLISSEGFQRCDPAKVRRIFSDFEVTVVVYIREQLSYLQSSYLQAIHAENYSGSIEEYEQDLFYCDYWSFLTSWENAFGSERLVTRVFSKEFMIEGDVVKDFFQFVLGERLESRVDYENADINLAALNASLEGDAIAFKKRLNQVIETGNFYFPDLYKALGEYRAGIDDPINLVSRKLARVLRKKYARSNKKVLNRYSLPASLLNFPEPGAHQTIKWMPPERFFEFLTMLVDMKEECSVLFRDCYHVEVVDKGSEWELEFCRNILVDSLPFVKIQRGDALQSLQEAGKPRGCGYTIPKESFSPNKDQLLLDFSAFELTTTSINSARIPISISSI